MPMWPTQKLARIALTLLFFLGGCASAKVEVYQNLDEPSVVPKTVAILPFTLGDDVREKENPPHNVFREVFFNYFSYLGYTDVPLEKVDQKLLQYDIAVTADPAELDIAALQKALEADAIVTGHILDANNFTGGIHAETSVHASLKMIDLATGETLWEVDHTEMNYSGIAAPTVVDLIQEQVANSKVKEAYYKSVEMFSMQVLKQIPDPAKLRRLEVRLPVITGIETNIRPGHKLKLDDRIYVSLRGQPGLTASFDIGSWKTSIAMKEITPGLYTGSYRIEDGDRVENAFIIGTLKDRKGFTSKKFYKAALATIDGSTSEPPPPGTTL